MSGPFAALRGERAVDPPSVGAPVWIRVKGRLPGKSVGCAGDDGRQDGAV